MKASRLDSGSRRAPPPIGKASGLGPYKATAMTSFASLRHRPVRSARPTSQPTQSYTAMTAQLC
eukprot:scaffold9863_cov40-Tisochrysis_lutea.AAC.1